MVPDIGECKRHAREINCMEEFGSDDDLDMVAANALEILNELLATYFFVPGKHQDTCYPSQHILNKRPAPVKEFLEKNPLLKENSHIGGEPEDSVSSN